MLKRLVLAGVAVVGLARAAVATQITDVSEAVVDGYVEVVGTGFGDEPGTLLVGGLALDSLESRCGVRICLRRRRPCRARDQSCRAGAIVYQSTRPNVCG